MKISDEKERLLCYAAGLFGSMMANPSLTNINSSETLMRQALRDANKLIELIYDDARLKKEILYDSD